jgi:hypothetical protein
MNADVAPTLEDLQEKLRVMKEGVIQATRMSYCGYIWHPQWVVEMFPDEGLRSSSGTYRKPDDSQAKSAVGKELGR